MTATLTDVTYELRLCTEDQLVHRYADADLNNPGLLQLVPLCGDWRYPKRHYPADVVEILVIPLPRKDICGACNEADLAARRARAAANR